VVCCGIRKYLSWRTFYGSGHASVKELQGKMRVSLHAGASCVDATLVATAWRFRGARSRISEGSAGIGLALLPGERSGTRGVSSDRPTSADAAEVQAVLGRALDSYAEIARRFDAIGGLERVFALYEQMRVELERVQFSEIDATAQVIKGAVETLLKMDYELRRLNNLKLAFGSGSRDG
jgi:hypothetical protein